MGPQISMAGNHSLRRPFPTTFDVWLTVFGVADCSVRLPELASLIVAHSNGNIAVKFSGGDLNSKCHPILLFDLIIMIR